MDCALAASLEIMGFVGVRKLKPVFSFAYLGIVLSLGKGRNLTDQVLDSAKVLAEGTHDLEDEGAKVHGLVVRAGRRTGEDGELSLVFIEGGTVHRVSPDA